MRISAIDKKILRNIQEHFPLCSRPYQFLGTKVGLTEKEVIKRVEKLQKNKIINRLGASLNHKRLGYYGTLIALKVLPERLTVISEKIVSYQEVTHCYIREGEYNLWFVFITPDPDKIKHLLKDLTTKIGKRNVLNLRTKKKLKLDTVLPL